MWGVDFLLEFFGVAFVFLRRAWVYIFFCVIWVGCGWWVGRRGRPGASGFNLFRLSMFLVAQPHQNDRWLEKGSNSLALI